MTSKNKRPIMSDIYDCAFHFNRNRQQTWSDTEEKYHYTSLPVLFNILEGDALWSHCSRFSNDVTEGEIFTDSINWYKDYHEEDFVLCFCAEGDLLSQWRGYCPKGGAAIEMAVNKIQRFSILEADYDDVKRGKHEVLESRAIPVIYSEKNLKATDQAIITGFFVWHL